MLFFESKPKLSIEECCRQFYDSNIFHAILVGKDAWASLLDTYFKLIAKADPTFLSVDSTSFRNEMTALRMELFAFAFQWSKKFKPEKKYAIPQSLFTRSYLEENGGIEIWDIMLEYNRVIAKSATMNAAGEIMPGALGRAWITNINLTRSNAWEDWMKATVVNVDATTQEEKDGMECAARAINRVGADINQSDSVVVTLLISKLASRLGCDVNLKYEALVGLGGIILGFYQGAEEYIKSVDLHG